MLNVMDILEETICTFGAEGEECENCRMPMPPGDPVHFFSDGGWESRDGTYVCQNCAKKIAAEMCGIDG